MRINKNDLLFRRYETLKALWHAKIDYLRMCEDNRTSFIQRAWLRLYIMNLKRELEDILFRMGRLRRFIPDECGRMLDKDI